LGHFEQWLDEFELCLELRFAYVLSFHSHKDYAAHLFGDYVGGDGGFGLFILVLFLADDASLSYSCSSH
jgi:hypothetical protein